MCPGKVFQWRIRFSDKQLCVCVFVCFKDVMLENVKCVLFFFCFFLMLEILCFVQAAATTALASFLSQLTE